MSLIFKNIFSQELKDVSLEIGDGDILAIIGPEAGGKYELFKIVVGETAIKNGEIVLDGKALKWESVFEDYSIYKRKIKKGPYFFSYRQWLKKIDEKKLDIVSKIMDIDRKFLLSFSPRHLSRGERKKFDLARYLITRRTMVLLDDPLSGMDWPTRKEVISALKGIIGQFSQPCLYMANSSEECEELKCRVALIEDGTVKYCGEWQPGLQI